MHIRSTLDPISHRDVPNPEEHPCLYEGDGDDGVEIYFENEDNLQQYINMKLKDKKTLVGNDSDEYVPEG